MKKLINLLIILFAVAFLFSGCQKGGEEESESFKKYGQEFEGKIAKSRVVANTTQTTGRHTECCYPSFG
jgi:hypothetical protein